MAHVGDETLPDGIYEPDELAIIRYARASSRLDPITDELYGALSAHFDTGRLIEICLTVGLSNMVNRFHATFLTDLDAATTDKLGDGATESH